MSKIRFRVDTASFKQALNTVSFVKPRAIGNGTESGYRFVVEGTKCSIYTRNNNNVARSQFNITDVEGEGTFLYPADHIKGFDYFTTGTILFEASHEGSTYKVNAVNTERKGHSAWRVTYNPLHVSPCDKDFADVKAASDGQVFSSATLKQALSLSSPFRPATAVGENVPATDGNKNKYTIEIYDARSDPKGAESDGVLFSTDGLRTFHFRSDDFVGKSLEIHSQHIDLIQQFLDNSPGRVTIYKGNSANAWTWAENSMGNILGWSPPRHKQASYRYYSTEQEVVFNIDPAAATEALAYLKTQIGTDGQRIKVIHNRDGQNSTLQFQIADEGSQAMGVTSWEIPITVNTAETKGDVVNFVTSSALESMAAIFKPISTSNQVMLRVFINPDPKRKRVMLRTVDTVMSEKGVEGAPQCKSEVTRFAPAWE